MLCFRSYFIKYKVIEHLPATDNITLEEKYRKSQEILGTKAITACPYSFADRELK